VPITPDTKDWTWVLERPCPECGFDSTAVRREHVGQLIRENAATWLRILARPGGLTDRPADDRWSALEYACHVRDVFELYDVRLQLMRTKDAPTFPNWDQDATAVEGRYGEQEPRQVALELDAAAQRLADDFDDVAPPEWSRTGMRSDGAHFTIESFARYLVHDPIHHVHDVEAGFTALESRS
jgi:DinB superfamily